MGLVISFEVHPERHMEWLRLSGGKSLHPKRPRSLVLNFICPLWFALFPVHFQSCRLSQEFISDESELFCHQWISVRSTWRCEFPGISPKGGVWIPSTPPHLLEGIVIAIVWLRCVRKPRVGGGSCAMRGTLWKWSIKDHPHFLFSLIIKPFFETTDFQPYSQEKNLHAVSEKGCCNPIHRIECEVPKSRPLDKFRWEPFQAQILCSVVFNSITFGYLPEESIKAFAGGRGLKAGTKALFWTTK